MDFVLTAQFGGRRELHGVLVRIDPEHQRGTKGHSREAGDVRLVAGRFALASEGPRRKRRCLLGSTAMIAFGALAAGPAVAENWVTVATYGITAIAVDADSVTVVEGSPETRSAWFRFTYAVMLDCSPPRGCLAASQRIQYRVTCGGGLGGAIAPIQRMLLDLAGNVLAQSEVTLDVAPYVPPTGTIESEMVSSFCSDPHFSSFVRSSPPPAWTPTRPVGPAPLPRE
jgi:hypothetical protein